MSYKVHKYNLNRAIDEMELQNFLNNLQGEIISIVPNIVPVFHLMGATAEANYLLIVEKN